MGDHEVAIEVKATRQANERHLKGLKSFAEEYSPRRLILVSNDPYPRKIEKYDLMPWDIFLKMLWNEEIIS